MKFDLQVGDRVRTVQIDRRADGYHVTVDGRLHIVDAVHLDGDDWSLLVRAGDAATAKSVQASVVSQRGNGWLDVHIDGQHIPIELKAGLGRRSRNRGASGQGNGPQRVSAPMPGRIARVLVKAGDAVKARQGLVVVEAMKMENELRATRDGRVREVFVTEGQSVDAKAPLVLVE
jgi:biotin carboxyl carrier protein